MPPTTLPLRVNAPAIQWYPGHIAKAEKALGRPWRRWIW